MNEHLNTQAFPEEESRRRLREFGEKVDALIFEYDLHGLVYTASIAESPSSDQPTGGAVSHSGLIGCAICNAVLLAQHIARNFAPHQLFAFMRYMQELCDLRHIQEITRGAAAGGNALLHDVSTKMLNNDRVPGAPETDQPGLRITEAPAPEPQQRHANESIPSEDDLLKMAPQGGKWTKN